MTNTIENKAKFFALYWGQQVNKYKINKLSPWKITRPLYSMTGTPYGWLELTPISQISIEDARHISILFGRDKPCGVTGVNILNGLSGREEKLTQPVIDYLRSKGYALPYMGLSVEKLIEYGWLKLKTE